MALFDTAGTAANKPKPKLPGARDPYAAAGQAPPPMAPTPTTYPGARDPYAAVGQAPPSYEGAPNFFDAVRDPYKITGPGGTFNRPQAAGGTGGGGFFDMWGNAIRGARDEAKGRGVATGPETPGVPDYGSQSGPGILESWFNQRATGTDPAFEYASKRGLESIANRSSAAGNFNSGATRQQESDFMANLVAQRMGQLDALAGGASGEHLGRLGMMFGQGQGIAGGQAGLSSAYDLGAAGNIAAANNAMNQMALNSAGQQQQANSGFVNNLMSLYGLYNMGSGSSSSGGSSPTRA